MRKDKMKELLFDEYVEMFQTVVPQWERVDRGTYRGRCPVCGDSKKSKFKKRFYIFQEKLDKPCVVYCHNCGLSASSYQFFTHNFPDVIDRYKKPLSEKDLSNIKRFIDNNGKEVSEIYQNTTPYKEPTIDELLIRFDKEKKKSELLLKKFFDKYTHPIFDDKEAVQYMQSRMVPEHYIQEMVLLKPEWHWNKRFRYSYFRDYIFIPFVDDEDRKYSFHARRYRKMNKKFAPYLGCPFKTDDMDMDFFLNEMRVTKDAPVIVAEGTIDSLNLPNSISLNGVNKLTKDRVKWFEARFGGQENIIYALDNEMLDIAACDKMKELLHMGKRVFSWKKMSEEVPAVSGIKDFNALCCKAKKTSLPLETIERFSVSNPSVLVEQS
jgi:transcription elongation factor Elf1